MRLPAPTRRATLTRVDVPITTQRLVLRRFTAADVDELLVLHDDPDVMRYLDGGGRATRAGVAGWLAPVLAGRAEGRRWAAQTADDGRFIGWFGLTGDGSRRELGYRLHRFAWGHGYATEGSAALLDLAFADPAVTRVWAQTMAVNHRSRAVLARLGMRHVRTFHEHFDDPLPGTEQGEVEYAIERAEWHER